MTNEPVFKEVQELDFLAFGTRYNNGAEKNVVEAPWQIYGVNESRFYRVLGMDGPDTVALRKLNKGTPEYGKVSKWIDERLVMQNQEASCNIKPDRLCEIIRFIKE